MQNPLAASRQATKLTLRIAVDDLALNPEWCFHPGEVDTDPEHPKYKAERPVLGRIFQAAREIVEGLPEGQLISFSWDLGACLPPDFVEALARRQPRLRELQFTTDVKCLGPPEDDAKRINGAGACFKKLRRFCWRGYTSMRQPIQLAEIVEANCQQLEELELDFGSRWLRKERKELTGELGSRGRLVHVLPQTVPSAPASFVFPALRVLSLTGVDLRDTAGKLNGAFDFESLESLSLRTCYNWQDFLAKIARSGDIFLGIVADGNDDDNHDVWTGCLEPHKATLKRLVCHERRYITVNRNTLSGGLCDWQIVDVYDLILRLQQHQNDFSAPTIGLDCLALSVGLDDLRDILKLKALKRRLKVLHIRQTGGYALINGSLALDFSGPKAGFTDGFEMSNSTGIVKSAAPWALQDCLKDEFRRIVEWAFGRRGMPSLQLIAFGDFAHGRSGYGPHNIFIVRYKEDLGWGFVGRPYRVHGARDKGHEHEWAHIVRPHWAFLEACPVAPLMGTLQSAVRHFF